MIEIKITNKKAMRLFISMVFLTSFCLLIPPTLGYGDDFHNAETITNGSYDVTLASDDEYAFYKIYCNVGDFLEVLLTADDPPYNLHIILYDPQFDYEANGGSCTYGCDTSFVVDIRGPQYIRIRRIDPDTGPIPFSMHVSGATGTEVPIVLITVISVISGGAVMGIVIFLLIRRRRKRKE